MLLTRNQTNGEDWYTLPGGGQEKFETLEEAVNAFAQFLAVCRRSKVGSMGTRRRRRDSRLCR
jgi:hypothetical protein